MTLSTRITALFGTVTLAIASPVTLVSAQDPNLSTVQQVELLSPRMDGPQPLVLFIGKGKLQPAAGVYRSHDQKTITVKDGRIVGISNPEAKLDAFQVVSVDQVAVRADFRPRLYLKDTRGRTAVLPDGRFTTKDGVALLVRDGTIVGYGKLR